MNAQDCAQNLVRRVDLDLLAANLVEKLTQGRVASLVNGKCLERLGDGGHRLGIRSARSWPADWRCSPSSCPLRSGGLCLLTTGIVYRYVPETVQRKATTRV